MPEPEVEDGAARREGDAAAARRGEPLPLAVEDGSSLGGRSLAIEDRRRPSCWKRERLLRER